MTKTYSDFMNELTPEDIYQGLLAHGLFCEKLPPVFTAAPFFNYCETLTVPFEDKPKRYISFESMRNVNVPRQFGIPNPMAYQRLCRCLADNWAALQTHFYDKTQEQKYKVSRIHIRKLSATQSLFEMSYTNWKIDGSPEPDLLIGKRYLVKADIATCFPSIYTHSLPWALVGKEQSKSNRGRNQWYNCIDYSSQQIKDGETHGLLIGPHASNLLSEIILTSIDYALTQQGWEYVRNIDDYSCYVSTHEQGQKFLIELNKQLRDYDLLLNHKKTEILELPMASVEQWVRQINAFNTIQNGKAMNYVEVRSYIDSAIELMQCNKGNAAILNYAIKVLKHRKLTENAKSYCVKTFLHLGLIYPYLVPLLEENVFLPFNVEKAAIEEFTQILFDDSMRLRNFEGVYYAIYYAIKRDFRLRALTAEIAIDTHDCLILLFSYKYFEKHADIESIRKLKAHAKALKAADFDSFWLFTYEVLPKSELTGAWKPMKDYGVSFIAL